MTEPGGCVNEEGEGGAAKFSGKKAKVLVEGDIVEWRAGCLLVRRNRNKGTYQKSPGQAYMQ